MLGEIFVLAELFPNAKLATMINIPIFRILGHKQRNYEVCETLSGDKQSRVGRRPPSVL